MIKYLKLWAVVFIAIPFAIIGFLFIPPIVIADALSKLFSFIGYEFADTAEKIIDWSNKDWK